MGRQVLKLQNTTILYNILTKVRSGNAEEKFKIVTFIIFQRIFSKSKYFCDVPHSSVLELRKNQFLKKINILKTFLEIETTHYLEGLDLKLNNETYAKVPNL